MYSAIQAIFRSRQCLSFYYRMYRICHCSTARTTFLQSSMLHRQAHTILQSSIQFFQKKIAGSIIATDEQIFLLFDLFSSFSSHFLFIRCYFFIRRYFFTRKNISNQFFNFYFSFFSFYFSFFSLFFC